MDAMKLSLTKNGVDQALILREGLAQPIPSAHIRETEVVGFVLRGQDITSPKLSIQDIPLGSADEATLLPDGIREFVWYPRSSNKPWFINHFGYSIVRVEMGLPSGTQSEVRLHQFYGVIEVYATKLNADRAMNILSFLEKNLSDVTRTCFSATSKLAGSQGETNPTPEAILQKINSDVQKLTALLSLFYNRKRSRLLSKTMRIKAEGALGLTDHSIAWVLSNLDTLIPAIPSPMNVLLGNNYFKVDELEAEVLYEDTDIYENRVIAGYLDDIYSRLSEVAKFYGNCKQKATTEITIGDVPVGFQSIQGIRRLVLPKYYDRLLSECEMLKRKSFNHRRFFQQNLAVRSSYRGMPNLTPGFLSQFHYHEVFKQIVDYYRLGSLNLSGEEFLFGLRTLDKLYEFYCLFRIIETILDSGWRLKAQDKIRYGTLYEDDSFEGIRPNNRYIFEHTTGLRMTLFYEAEIITSSQTDGGLIDTFHTGFGPNSKYVPDFVLQIERETDIAYVVLDAKYVAPKDAFDRYGENRYTDRMTELCMKYLHGIGYQQGGFSPVLALLILHPGSTHTDDIDKYRSYHREQNGLFSENPSLPIMGAIDVTPTPEVADNVSDNILKSVVKQLLAVLG
jgi:hypothetical protein